MAVAIILPSFLPVAFNQTAEAATTATLPNLGTGDTWPAGSVVVAWAVANNAGVSGASAFASVQDSNSNTWNVGKLQNRTAGSAANDGCTVLAYYAVLNAPMLFDGTDSITFNWSPNVAAKVCGAFAISGSDTSPFNSNSAAGAGTAYTSGGASASLNSGDIIVGVAGNESNTSPVNDTDTTNGSWTSLTTIGSGGSGGDATKMSGLVAYKVVNAAGAQTFNGATGANTDWAALYLAFHVFTEPPVTTAGQKHLAAVGVGIG